MRNILIIALLFICASCRAPFPDLYEDQPYQVYTIKKIKRQNDWYIIDAKHDRTPFKILSRISEDDSTFVEYPLIKKGKTYKMELFSYKGSFYRKLGVGPPMQLYGRGDSELHLGNTVIRLSRKKGFRDIFYTPNLRGLHYLPDSDEVDPYFK